MAENQLEAQVNPGAADVVYRRGNPADSRDVYDVFVAAILDLSQRLNVMAITGAQDPEVRNKLWQRRKPLFDHLARTAHQFWLAEAEGKPIGYARSILRAGVWELTEFFVLPQRQSGGVGRGLLHRVLPDEDVRHKVIIATPDVRAQARYLKLDVYPRFPLTYFSREPEDVPEKTDLAFVEATPTPGTLSALRKIDRQIVGHDHDEDHAWLLAEREGFLYVRDGDVVGYGYTGQSNGPFALLDEADFPAVLAHAESLAARHGREFGVEAPLINRSAIAYLLGRGYQMDSFFAFFMSEAPFGHFERYLFPSPPFFM